MDLASFSLVDVLILLAIGAALIPLGSSIFYYVTIPSDGRRWVRKPSAVFLQTPIGQAYLNQKIVLFLVMTYILSARLFGEYPYRDLIAWVLYTALVFAFWRFFIVQRKVQRGAERAEANEDSS